MTRRHLLESAEKIVMENPSSWSYSQTTDKGLTTVGFLSTLTMQPSFSSLSSSASTKSGLSLADLLLASMEGGGTESNSSLYPSRIAANNR